MPRVHVRVNVRVCSAGSGLGAAQAAVLVTGVMVLGSDDGTASSAAAGPVQLSATEHTQLLHLLPGNFQNKTHFDNRLED